MSGIRVDRTVALQYHYIGDPDTDGSLRLLRSGNNFTVEERIDGSWVARDITGNSLAIFDPIVKDESDVVEPPFVLPELSIYGDEGSLFLIDVDVEEFSDYTLRLEMSNPTTSYKDEVVSFRMDIKVHVGQSIYLSSGSGISLIGLNQIFLPEDAVSSLLVDKPAGQENKYYIRQLV